MSPSPVTTRVSFSVSPGGTHAACLASAADGPLEVESWSLSGVRATSRRLGGGPAPLHTQLVALDDGRVLACRVRDGIAEIVRLAPHRRPRTVGTVPAFGLRLLPVPATGRPILAVSNDQSGRSALWRVRDDLSAMEYQYELPDPVLDGVWLDPDGGRLAVNVRRGTVTKAALLDLATATLTPLLDVTATSDDRVLAAGPRSGLLLMSTDAVGGEHVGWTLLGANGPARFPAVLHQDGEAMRPVCVDPAGSRVLVHGDRGVRSRLAVYHPGDDTLVDVTAPPGRVAGPGQWTGDVIWIPYSTPTRPATMAAIMVDPLTGGAGMTGACAPPAGPWAPAHVVELPGAAGDVEAIVYGGPDWRRADHLVVALHGGPRAGWRLDFDPLFQRFAAAGIAVVAPNQRGSTGYGPAHADAIKAAWGVPDLADVLRIGTGIAAARRAAGLAPPALFGTSYGAYLGLLAAACEPSLWSGCVALAPFTSTARLYRDANPEVRALIDMLDGLVAARDAVGPRDLLRLCHRIRVPVLLAHGARDEVIDVAHSRDLYRQMRGVPADGGDRVRYLEVPDAGHDLLTAARPDLLDRVVGFLSGPRIGVLPGPPEYTKGGVSR